MEFADYDRPAGMLMSGKVIAPTSAERIVYGTYGTIPGFMEMLLLMPKGSKVKALIPSALAYGREGRDGSIQAYTPLVYEMEMVDILHATGRGR
jgi:FKBP-type peptidyl-prolyl cis-trans isomerase FklB